MTETPKNRPNPGGVTESGMIYEQIEKDGMLQYAVRMAQDKEIKIRQNLPMGPSVIYYPLQPSPWTLPSEPIPSSTLEELWQEIRQFVYDHLDLENDALYDVIVAWIIASWTPEKWETAPYLHFHGPSNSGKTRGLEILSALAYRPMLSPSVSASSIYRALDAYHPTFLLDEFEIYFKMQDLKSEVIGVLNAGYKKGQYVLRTDKVMDGAPTLKAFSCFGFKGIGSIQELPLTLHGRTIVIPMSKAVRKVKRLIDHQKARELRSKLLFYRFENVISSPPIGNPIDLPDGRLIELYTPLCMVAPKDVEPKILSHALNEYKQDVEQERSTDEANVYINILEVLEEEVSLRVFQETVRNKINVELSEKRQWGKQKLRANLKRLGFKTEAGTKKEGRLSKIVIDSSILERRKTRYVLPEEMEVVDNIIEKIKKLEKESIIVSTFGTVGTFAGGKGGNASASVTAPPPLAVETVLNVPSVPLSFNDLNLRDGPHQLTGEMYHEGVCYRCKRKEQISFYYSDFKGEKHELCTECGWIVSKEIEKGGC